jgi:hypothetical protein
MMYCESHIREAQRAIHQFLSPLHTQQSTVRCHTRQRGCRFLMPHAVQMSRLLHEFTFAQLHCPTSTYDASLDRPRLCRNNDQSRTEIAVPRCFFPTAVFSRLRILFGLNNWIGELIGGTTRWLNWLKGFGYIAQIGLGIS